jgi:hypothetical protein
MRFGVAQPLGRALVYRQQRRHEEHIERHGRDLLVSTDARLRTLDDRYWFSMIVDITKALSGFQVGGTVRRLGSAIGKVETPQVWI